MKDIEYIFNPRSAETEQLASMMVARTKIFDDVLVIFGDLIFDSQILQQILASNDDIAIAIDLDWEKSYNERPDNPKSLADKVLINQKKVLRISYKQTDTMIENQTVGEFLGVIKLSANGSRTIIKKYEELEKSYVGKFHDADSFKKAKLVDILQEFRFYSPPVTLMIVLVVNELFELARNNTIFEISEGSASLFNGTKLTRAEKSLVSGYR